VDPKNADAYNIRASSYEEKGDYDHVIADYDHALKLNASLEDARRDREPVQALLVKPDNPGPQTDTPAGASVAVMPTSRRIALVIGMSAYANVAPLRNPARDARAVAVAFHRLGFVESRYKCRIPSRCTPHHGHFQPGVAWIAGGSRHDPSDGSAFCSAWIAGLLVRDCEPVPPGAGLRTRAVEKLPRG
jgi:tetratricopeptide (TPR) repeat protein